MCDLLSRAPMMTVRSTVACRRDRAILNLGGQAFRLRQGVVEAQLVRPTIGRFE